jgi:hypothetical protein
MFIRNAPDFVKTMSAIAPSFFAGVPDAETDSVVRALANDLATNCPQGFVCTSGGLQAVARKLAPPPPMPMPGPGGGGGQSRFIGVP